jgi:N-acetyl sugar amidotransferase
MNLFRCTRCLYPSTKPDIWFDARGVCSACIAFDKRSEIDWAKRRDEFMALVNANRGKSHDVIVACSGGKDSTYQVVKCLELGLRPLAVCATTDHLSALGRKNLDNIANLCDLVEVTPHKPTRRRISKFALEEVGDISWCEHHLIWSVPARESIARDIPIVLYGECPQNEYGAGPAGSEKQTHLTHSWVHEFGGLLGLRLSDVGDILKIDPCHLDVYRYPQNAESVKAVFMGAYFEWDGYENFKVAERNGFTPYHQFVEGSIFGYENVDNLQTGIHDFLRALKFGYGRAVDIASSHIRRSRMTRAEAVKLVADRDGKFPQTYLGVPVEDILAELDMTREDFYKVCDRFTNREVVAWASSSASFQSFSGTTTVQSKENSSTQVAA